MVKVWDVESGDELFALKGHTRQVWSVAFSPDGKHLASAAVSGPVLVREAKPVQKALVFGGGPRGVGNMAFSPDGKRLTTLGQGEPKVWDTQTGEELLSIDARSDIRDDIRGNDIRGNVALSLDGRRLAGGGDTFHEGLWNPNQANSANIWDLLTGEKLLTIRRVGMARIFALSPDGSRLLITNNLRIGGSTPLTAQPSQLFDANTGQEIRSWKAPRVNMIFSPDGKLLAGYPTANTLKLWDAQTGDEVLTITGAAGPRAFSRDGKRLATASDDPTVVKLWDVQTGEELLSLKGHSGAIMNVAFSPDNNRLATTSNDETIKVWDTQTAQELLTLPGGGGIAFSPNGNRLAAGGPNGTIMIYDATPLPEKP
jgi:WD40 repeat protein